jgi:hypothetical protein
MSNPGTVTGQTESAQEPAPDAPYGVLKIPDFRLYLIARFIASLGQQMLIVAVDWEIYERTHSALALGLVGLTQMIPMFMCTLPAGHLADNFNRKRIIMAMTGVMAFCSLGLALVSAFKAPVFLMYLCLFTAGMARTFMWPASAAFLPQIVSRENFPRAVNWSSSTFHLSSVLGPTVCGALIGDAACCGHTEPRDGLGITAAQLDKGRARAFGQQRESKMGQQLAGLDVAVVRPGRQLAHCQAARAARAGQVGDGIETGQGRQGVGAGSRVRDIPAECPHIPDLRRCYLVAGFDKQRRGLAHDQ